MDRINHPTATAERTFTGGNPAADIPATIVTPEYMTMLQEEVCNVIAAAGLTLSGTDDTQLGQAIAKLIAAQAVEVEIASETVAGILKLATAAQALAGTDAVTAMTPADVAAAIIGAPHAYTRKQTIAPVSRAGASGSQAVSLTTDSVLLLTATGAIALAQPTDAAVGDSLRVVVYSAASVAITYANAYAATTSHDLPTATTAGKWLVMDFSCLAVSGSNATKMLLMGWTEEA